MPSSGKRAARWLNGRAHGNGGKGDLLPQDPFALAALETTCLDFGKTKYREETGEGIYYPLEKERGRQIIEREARTRKLAGERRISKSRKANYRGSNQVGENESQKEILEKKERMGTHGKSDLLSLKGDRRKIRGADQCE